MEPKPNEHLKAHNLYFQTDLSQEQIAELLNINRKTLHLWIKDGGWKRIKYATTHAPSVLVEQYYHQLSEINIRIAQREDQPWPTKEEADTIRKITMTIKQIRNGKHALSECIEVFEQFTSKLKRNDFELTKKLLPHVTNHVRDLTQKGKMFKVAQLRHIEEEEDKEYEEWLQAQEEEKSESQNGVQNGATPPPATPTEPLPTAQITENYNSNLSTKKTKNVDNSDLSFPAEVSTKEGTKKTENVDIKSTKTIALGPQVSIPPESADCNCLLPPVSSNLPASSNPTLTMNEIMALPPDMRPSPYRDGNIIWVNDMDDVEKRLDNFGKPWGQLKMADIIRCYPLK